MLRIIVNKSEDLAEVGRYWIAVYPVDESGAFVECGAAAGFLATWGFESKAKANEVEARGPVRPKEGKAFASTDEAFRAAARAIEEEAELRADAPVIVSVI